MSWQTAITKQKLFCFIERINWLVISRKTAPAEWKIKVKGKEKLCTLPSISIFRRRITNLLLLPQHHPTTNFPTETASNYLTPTFRTWKTVSNRPKQKQSTKGDPKTPINISPTPSTAPIYTETATAVTRTNSHSTTTA